MPIAAHPSPSWRDPRRWLSFLIGLASLAAILAAGLPHVAQRPSGPFGLRRPAATTDAGPSGGQAIGTQFLNARSLDDARSLDGRSVGAPAVDLPTIDRPAINAQRVDVPAFDVRGTGANPDVRAGEQLKAQIGYAAPQAVGPLGDPAADPDLSSNSVISAAGELAGPAAPRSIVQGRAPPPHAA